MSTEVVLDCFDNDIKDGDSNAIFSYEYGEHCGEVFRSRCSNQYEVYPHDGKDEPVAFVNEDPTISVADFVRDSVLKVHNTE